MIRAELRTKKADKEVHLILKKSLAGNRKSLLALITKKSLSKLLPNGRK